MKNILCRRLLSSETGQHIELLFFLPEEIDSLFRCECELIINDNRKNYSAMGLDELDAIFSISTRMKILLTLSPNFQNLKLNWHGDGELGLKNTIIQIG